ncbi:hypothetical protein DLH72_01235 [Candidatus Gracilibacteria bacterium]|nr:MAG: hypothetical protein DLH72_01235 [Candidatus Gracilibacteria bacterium]
MVIAPEKTKTKIKSDKTIKKSDKTINFSDKVTEKSDKIENIEEEAFEFIKHFEGFTPKAEWDHKHCSIGYGTNSPGLRPEDCRELITEAEARKRAIQKIKDIRKHFNFYDLDDNVEIALISFTYNIGKPPANYRWYIKNNYKKALKNLMLKYVYASGQKLKGLEKRRRAETDLF